MFFLIFFSGFTIDFLFFTTKVNNIYKAAKKTTSFLVVCQKKRTFMPEN